ncbi:DUF202 domain-containing protein [Variovorax rhizosphaerae]|uniref:DUF202 domain-containing protein n=1 Tax=Variovorax rhizosphaerae TaxID=1836200 RepID=A0ABU8WKJ5_9BURK
MRDPGLQPERTAMAWTRTAISAMVCAVVYLKLAFSAHSLLLGVGGTVLLFGALGLVLISMRRRVDLVDVNKRAAPAGHLLKWTAVIVCIGAMASTAAALV